MKPFEMWIVDRPFTFWAICIVAGICWASAIFGYRASQTPRDTGAAFGPSSPSIGQPSRPLPLGRGPMQAT